MTKGPGALPGPFFLGSDSGRGGFVQWGRSGARRYCCRSPARASGARPNSRPVSLRRREPAETARLSPSATDHGDTAELRTARVGGVRCAVVRPSPPGPLPRKRERGRTACAPSSTERVHNDERRPLAGAPFAVAVRRRRPSSTHIHLFGGRLAGRLARLTPAEGNPPAVWRGSRSPRRRRTAVSSGSVAPARSAEDAPKEPGRKARSCQRTRCGKRRRSRSRS